MLYFSASVVLTKSDWSASKYGSVNNVEAALSSVIVIADATTSHSPAAGNNHMPSNGTTFTVNSTSIFPANILIMSMSNPVQVPSSS